jgi:hypothetical protein
MPIGARDRRFRKFIVLRLIHEMSGQRVCEYQLGLRSSGGRGSVYVSQACTLAQSPACTSCSAASRWLTLHSMVRLLPRFAKHWACSKALVGTLSFVVLLMEASAASFPNSDFRWSPSSWAVGPARLSVVPKTAPRVPQTRRARPLNSPKTVESPQWVRSR